MSYVYMFSDGSYSDYGERWLTHPKKMSKQGIRQVVKEAYPRALVLFERLQKRKWDECERLFGQRTWPWNSGLRSPKGTDDDFIAWRDRYTFNLTDLTLREAGFRYLIPHYQEDFDYSFDDAVRKMAGIKYEWEYDEDD